MTTEINQPQSKVVKVKIFNQIDLTKANKIAKVSKPTEKAKKILKTKVKVSKNYIDYSDELISNDTHIETSPASIRRFIDDSHPDVRKFIFENQIYKLKAEAGILTVTTRNSFKVVIKVHSDNARHITITDPKRNVVFKGISVFTVKKQK